MGAEQVTVYSPVPGYTGLVINVEFDDGKGSVSDDDHQALAYFRRHDYGIGERSTVAEAVSPDPREVGEGGSGIAPVGTRLRDAAVDAEPGDFLAPTNAGAANPHGPEVVSPGLHATPPAPIVPGPVSSDPETQQAVETEAAEAVLVDQEPVAEVVADAVEEQGQPTAATTKARAKKAPARA